VTIESGDPSVKVLPCSEGCRWFGAGYPQFCVHQYNTPWNAATPRSLSCHAAATTLSISLLPAWLPASERAKLASALKRCEQTLHDEVASSSM